MSAVECEHGELIGSGIRCGPCERERTGAMPEVVRGPSTVEVVPRVRPVRARLGGPCRADCGEPIQIADEILPLVDDGGWIHATCDPDRDLDPGDRDG